MKLGAWIGVAVGICLALALALAVAIVWPAWDTIASGLVAQRMHDATSLSASEIRGLERDLKTDPSDSSVRLKLLAYHFDKHFDEPESAAKHEEHLAWFITNEPTSIVLETLESMMVDSVSTRERLSAFWADAIDVHEDDVDVLRHAANFYLLFEPKTAERLLMRAQKQHPHHFGILKDLGKLYEADGKLELGDVEAGQRALAAYEAALEHCGTICLLETSLRIDAAKAAVRARRFERAEHYAHLLLNADPLFSPKDADAIHHGHLALGHVALARNDIVAARKRLLDAGRVPGSPALSSFGPNMMLAKRMLEAGESETVLAYFDLVRKFWESGCFGTLDEWTAEIQDGKVPDFGANLTY